jgi:hypothetical protein
MEVVAKSSGKTKGNEIVDLSSGIVKEIKTTVESAGTVQVMGQEVPMTTKVTTSSTVKKS